MNTTFTVKVDGKNSQPWAVDLGVDVLEGLSLDSIKALALDSKKIVIQGPIRKHCNSSAEAIEGYLHRNGYPNAVVTKYVPTGKVNPVRKFIADTLGVDISSVTDEMVATVKAKMVA